jgi:RNA processing factor Prp31
LIATVQNTNGEDIQITLDMTSSSIAQMYLDIQNTQEQQNEVLSHSTEAITPYLTALVGTVV